MARILVLEPYPEVRELLARVVQRLGHVALDEVGGAGELSEVDAVILEPSLRGAQALVRLLRKDRPELPVVCVSIYPADAETAALEPVAYVLKPFALGELTRAVELAVAG